MDFFERISSKTSMLKSGTLSINEVVVGGGTFVGRESDNFVAKWRGAKGWDVQREEPGMWRHASMYGTVGDRTCIVIAYATGTIRVSVGPKRDMTSNQNAKDATVFLRDQLVPGIVRDALNILDINAPSNAKIRATIRPVNAAATGSIRRAFVIPWGRDQNADVVGNTIEYELSRSQRAGVTVVTTMDPRPPYPIRFGFYQKQTRDDVAKWFSWYGHPVAGGGSVVLYRNVSLTPAGARKFQGVTRFMKREPRIGVAVDAKVNFRSGDIEFMGQGGVFAVESYAGVVQPVRIARMQIRRTGYVQITGSIDLHDMFAMYAILEKVFSLYTEWFDETVVNRPSPSRRGAAGRRAGDPQRRGRKEGSTCKPPNRLPAPNTFEGTCPDPEHHVRPNAQGFPCCFKSKENTAAFRKSIEKAYAKAGVQIPVSLQTRFGMAPIAPTARRTEKASLDAKGRLVIDKKQCRSMPVKTLEAYAESVGVSLTVEKGGRRHKLKKDELCREIQAQRIFDMVRLDEASDVLYILDVPCATRNEAYVRTYMTGLGITIPDGVDPCEYMKGWFKLLKNARSNANNARSNANANNARSNANNANNARSNANNANNARSNANANRQASFNFDKMLENAMKNANTNANRQTSFNLEKMLENAMKNANAPARSNFRVLDNFFTSSK